MSKGKYKRKRKRAEECAKAKRTELYLAGEKAITSENQRETSKHPNHKCDGKEETFVGIGGVIKRSSFTDWCLMVFTGMLTVTAIYQYLASIRQLSVMRNDERAWIEVRSRPGAKQEDSSLPVQIVEGQPIIWNISYINTGKTPATHIKVSVFIEVLQAIQEVTLDCVDEGEVCQPNKVYGGIAFPNAPDDIPVMRPGNGNATADESKDWNDGKTYAAVFGILTYDDVFNVSHWTRFCFWGAGFHGARASALSCAQYNKEDPNQE